MNKKKCFVLFALILTAVAMLCLACSKREENADIIDVGASEASEDEVKTSANEAEYADGSEERNVRGKASSQMDIIGEVESIVGNETTMALMSKAQDGSYTATGDTGVYLIPVGMSVGNGDYSSVSSGMILGLDVEDDTVMSVKVLRRAS